MTVLQDVWLTTEDGDVVRAAGVAGFHLKLVGPDGVSGTPRPPTDVELWMTVEHFDQPIRLVGEAAEHMPDVLAELITVLSDAIDTESPLLFVRPVPNSSAAGGVGAWWAVETTAPLKRWRDFVLG